MLSVCPQKVDRQRQLPNMPTIATQNGEHFLAFRAASLGPGHAIIRGNPKRFVNAPYVRPFMSQLGSKPPVLPRRLLCPLSPIADIGPTATLPGHREPGTGIDPTPAIRELPAARGPISSCARDRSPKGQDPPARGISSGLGKPHRSAAKVGAREPDPALAGRAGMRAHY
jgi:hypothetical protein